MSAGEAGRELPPLRDVIRQYDLRARKSLGQNFLLDLNLTGRIARAAGPLDGVTVVEVGPGPGGLTRALLAEGAAKVIAIERDRRCVEALADLQAAYGERLELVEADALKLDYGALAPSPYRIVANLPYNIATALLVRWLSSTPWPPPYDRLVLMFQREVAERIVAMHGSGAYGRLSVLAQWRTEPRILFNIPPQAFTPPPKVVSTVVELVPRSTPHDCSLEGLEAVTMAAFGQRRKMLRSSLKSLGLAEPKLLEELGIEATARAETLSVETFCRLAERYEKLLAK
jgi:16S rRNA (adenine1518-N6/adenine1519-N6)-dimethyltransferase